ncbi:MAG: phosphoribosylglycinamide formyltransferase [Rhodothermales bacterium]
MRLAVFASGSGSNFEAIARAIEEDALPARLALCLSNRPDAGVFERAARFGVPTETLRLADFAQEANYTAALLGLLLRYDVTFIALAGYLRRIPPEVVHAFSERIVNIHPALLPAFGGHGMYGRRVHEAALDYGVRWSGATVHLVDNDYDTGPIVLQEPVPVHPDDTPEALAARVLEAEHLLYPEALRLFAEGRVAVEGRKVVIREAFIEP